MFKVCCYDSYHEMDVEHEIYAQKVNITDNGDLVLFNTDGSIVALFAKGDWRYCYADDKHED